MASALPSVCVSMWLVRNHLFARYGPAGVLRLSQAFVVLGWAVLVTAPWSAKSVFIGSAILGFAVMGLVAAGPLLAAHFKPRELAQAYSLLGVAVGVAAIVAMPAFAGYFDAGQPDWRLPCVSLAFVACSRGSLAGR